MSLAELVITSVKFEGDAAVTPRSKRPHSNCRAQDYWACQALRAITAAHRGEVVFKGGTSLEKLRIIRRFSEDLDLLVVGDSESNRATERALRSMVDAAAGATQGAITGGRRR